LYLAEGEGQQDLRFFYLADGSPVATEAKTGFLFVRDRFWQQTECSSLKTFWLKGENPSGVLVMVTA
jgi:hypothetical protein